MSTMIEKFEKWFSKNYQFYRSKNEAFWAYSAGYKARRPTKRTHDLKRAARKSDKLSKPAVSSG